GNAIVDGSASTPLFPDINTPAYRYGINLNAPLEYGIVMPRGIVNEAIGITTVAGHPGRIEWGGVATARLRPDTTTNDFWIESGSGKFVLTNTTESFGAFLDISGVTGSKTFTFPDASGTICLTTTCGAPSPLTTKGDVWGFSTVDARIPVGADGTVLTADSGQALGLRWATPTAQQHSIDFVI